MKTKRSKFYILNLVFAGLIPANFMLANHEEGLLLTPVPLVNLVPTSVDESVTDFFDLESGKFVLTGSGCSLENTFVGIDGEQNVLDLSFGQYYAAGSTARTNCASRIGIRSIPGKRLVVTRMGIAGRAALPPGGSGRISFSTNLGATLGPRISKVLKAEDEDVEGNFTVARHTEFSTSCNDEAGLLGINTAVVMASSAELAAITVDRVALAFRVDSCD